MSSGQEKSTQVIYTGSPLSQELHSILINHWVSTMQSKSRLQTHHQRSDLEHLKSHTSFDTQTPQKSEHPLILHYTPVFRNTRDTERITPDEDQIKRLQQSYSTSLRKPKSLNANLENSNMFSHFHKCLKIVLSLEERITTFLNTPKRC